MSDGHDIHRATLAAVLHRSLFWSLVALEDLEVFLTLVGTLQAIPWSSSVRACSSIHSVGNVSHSRYLTMPTVFSSWPQNSCVDQRTPLSSMFTNFLPLRRLSTTLSALRLLFG